MNTPRYQHVRFCDLNTGENFFYRKYRYYKANCYTGRAIRAGDPVFIFPWTKVRSTRPFGKLVVLRKTIVGHVAQTLAVNAPYSNVINIDPRPPVPVTPGGDRTPEAIGGNELTPSA